MARGVVIIIITGHWAHIDFSVFDPSSVCEWVFEIDDIEIIVIGNGDL